MCMPITMRRTVLTLLLTLVIPSHALFCGAALAEDIQKSADDLLDRTRQISDIRAQNAPPFRLSLTFSYTGKDLETMKGTYTEFWMSNTQWAARNCGRKSYPRRSRKPDPALAP